MSTKCSVPGHKKLSWIANLSIWLGVIACWASLTPWPMWRSEYLAFILMFLFMGVRIVLWNGQTSWATIVSMVATIGFGFIYAQLFINGIVASIFHTLSLIFPILIFLTFKAQEKKIFLRRLINLFSAIALISLIGFLLHFFINLPYVITKHYNSFYAPFKNYIIFVVTQTGDLGWFTRFTAIYSEPGHLSMACAILLYINGYTLRKWQNLVLTISVIWSFSLAGFLLYFGGLILYILAKSKRIGKTLMRIIGGTSLLVILGLSYYSPTNDDIVSVKILSRLEFDESKGIAGNNRNSINFDQYYDEFISGEDKWLGIGRGEVSEMFGGTGNSSYKNYVLGNGIIGMLAILFLMGTFLFCYPSRKGFGLMILLMVSFLQRPYFLWAIECFPYLAALSGWFGGRIVKKADIKTAMSKKLISNNR